MFSGLANREVQVVGYILKDLVSMCPIFLQYSHFGRLYVEKLGLGRDARRAELSTECAVEQRIVL